jgi:rare lipoprotein A
MQIRPTSSVGAPWRVAGPLAIAALATMLAGPAAAQAADTDTQATMPGIAQAVESVLARGKATWYGPKFHGRRTSSGERFDMNDYTAAHPFLPFGTLLLVRNVANGREVIVRVNDRAPPLRDRIIDLSKAAANALGFVKNGRAPVVLLEP